MSTFYTQDAWVETFKPIINPNNHWGEGATYSAFETYDEDFEKVKATDNKYVWTEVDGDCGTYIVAGQHWVNRIHYFITEVPWTDEWTEVPTWSYRQCDCTDEEEFEEVGYNPDCDECDEGMIDIDVDTVADLKVLYGDDANVIA